MKKNLSPIQTRINGSDGENEVKNSVFMESPDKKHSMFGRFEMISAEKRRRAMWWLIRKDFPFLLFYVMIFLFLGGVYGIIRRSELDTGFIIMFTQWIFLMMLGGINMIERIEDKSQGYLIFRTLPLSDKDVVHAKFTSVFITILLVVTFDWIYFSLLAESKEILKLAHSAVLLSGNLSLIMAALIYVVIFKVGFTRISRVGWVILFFLVAISPIILIEWGLTRLPITRESIIRFHSLPNWTLITLISMSVFLGLRKIALNIKSITSRQFD